ncbi:transposon TX1 uncharacterized 149 kDa protein [Elysia marginata]|uniref:Transposon TX1 uncharacterized 149 kDa protein n=1 Tax=Elysia marginata TaxID=1093978 RepID=A0AAV4J343_9GAST|nr:transposon TX1 uncharacterized 149 kDa protein [Elysia marginata]
MRKKKIWPTDKAPLVITLPKKGNLRQCQNYRTISLISHTSKVMLDIILNHPKPKAEELSEEIADFRACRSTVEKIFICWILIDSVIGFKKAFDRVWHVLGGFQCRGRPCSSHSDALQNLHQCSLP